MQKETSPDEYNQVSHLSFLTLAEKFGVQSRDEHVKSAEVPSHESTPREETLMETTQPQPVTEESDLRDMLNIPALTGTD